MSDEATYERRRACIRHHGFRTDMGVLWLGEIPATILTTTERGMVLISVDEPRKGLQAGSPHFVEPFTLELCPRSLA